MFVIAKFDIEMILNNHQHMLGNLSPRFLRKFGKTLKYENMPLNADSNFLTYVNDYFKIISMSNVAMTNMKLL